MEVTLFCLASVWFGMACAVAVRVLRGLGAEDTRSDDEGEDGEEALEDVPEVHTTGNGGSMGGDSRLDTGVANLRKRK